MASKHNQSGVNATTVASSVRNNCAQAALAENYSEIFSSDYHYSEYLTLIGKAI